jgi:hypothetical protein
MIIRDETTGKLTEVVSSFPFDESFLVNKPKKF